MPNTEKVSLGGKEYEAVRVEANQSTELWNQYLLDDGALLKLKTVVTELFRVKDLYDESGNPVYVVKSGNIVTVVAPENLRKK